MDRARVGDGAVRPDGNDKGARELFTGRADEDVADAVTVHVTRGGNRIAELGILAVDKEADRGSRVHLIVRLHSAVLLQEEDKECAARTLVRPRACADDEIGNAVAVQVAGRCQRVAKAEAVHDVVRPSARARVDVRIADCLVRKRALVVPKEDNIDNAAVRAPLKAAGRRVANCNISDAVAIHVAKVGHARAKRTARVSKVGARIQARHGRRERLVVVHDNGKVGPDVDNVGNVAARRADKQIDAAIAFPIAQRRHGAAKSVHVGLARDEGRRGRAMRSTARHLPRPGQLKQAQVGQHPVACEIGDAVPVDVRVKDARRAAAKVLRAHEIRVRLVLANADAARAAVRRVARAPHRAAVVTDRVPVVAGLAFVDNAVSACGSCQKVDKHAAARNGSAAEPSLRTRAADAAVKECMAREHVDRAVAVHIGTGKRMTIADGLHEHGADQGNGARLVNVEQSDNAVGCRRQGHGKRRVRLAVKNGTARNTAALGSCPGRLKDARNGRRRRLGRRCGKTARRVEEEHQKLVAVRHCADVGHTVHVDVADGEEARSKRSNTRRRRNRAIVGKNGRCELDIERVAVECDNGDGTAVLPARVVPGIGDGKVDKAVAIDIANGRGFALTSARRHGRAGQLDVAVGLEKDETQCAAACGNIVTDTVPVDVAGTAEASAAKVLVIGNQVPRRCACQRSIGVEHQGNDAKVCARAGPKKGAGCGDGCNNIGDAVAVHVRRRNGGNVATDSRRRHRVIAEALLDKDGLALAHGGRKPRLGRDCSRARREMDTDKTGVRVGLGGNEIKLSIAIHVAKRQCVWQRIRRVQRLAVDAEAGKSRAGRNKVKALHGAVDVEKDKDEAAGRHGRRKGKVGRADDNVGHAVAVEVPACARRRLSKGRCERVRRKVCVMVDDRGRLDDTVCLHEHDVDAALVGADDEVGHAVAVHVAGCRDARAEAGRRRQDEREHARQGGGGIAENGVRLDGDVRVHEEEVDAAAKDSGA